MTSAAPRRQLRPCGARCLARCAANTVSTFTYMCFKHRALLYLQVDNVFGLFLLFLPYLPVRVTLGLMMTQSAQCFTVMRRFVPVFDADDSSGADVPVRKTFT